MKILETERLYLRKMGPDDFEDLCKILGDEETMYAYEGAFSHEEAREWLDRQMARYEKWGFGLWAVILKENGEMIGQCGLTMQPWKDQEVLEIGYLFRRSYWHKGYASEAAKGCKKYAFQVLKADQVCSIIRDTNTASQNVALRSGMAVKDSWTKHYRGVDMPHYRYVAVRPTEGDEYAGYLSKLIPEKDSLKLVKTQAKAYYQSHSSGQCFRVGLGLYESDNFQVQEVGVFLLGYGAHDYPEALAFLKNTVSRHYSWKVQETLAMAFDNHCKLIGYENALPLIKEWFGSSQANVRRAVSEGLRVWTSRPYFKDNPQAAISLLAEHRDDASEYVRRSVGNAIRDISKKHGALVSKELSTWDLSSREVKQVYKLAGRFIMEKADQAARG